MIKQLVAAVLALFAAAAFAAVDANKASQTELEAVKGIGPAISTKILEERKKGAFKNWPDLVERVKGIGDGNAAKFSTEGLTVNGAAFAGAPVKAATPATPAVVRNDDAKAPAATKVPPAQPMTPSPAAAGATKAQTKMPADNAASAPIGAADKKAAAKAERDEKKSAKAAAADDAKKAKPDQGTTKDAKDAKDAKPADAKPAAAKAASAAASAAKK